MLPNCRQSCQVVMQIIMGGCVFYSKSDRSQNLCILCSGTDSVEHFLYECTGLDMERKAVMHSASVFLKNNEFDNMNMVEKWWYILMDSGFYTIEEWSVFGSMVARSIHAMLQVKRDVIAGL